MIANKLHLILC